MSNGAVATMIIPIESFSPPPYRLVTGTVNARSSRSTHSMATSFLGDTINTRFPALTTRSITGNVISVFPAPHTACTSPVFCPSHHVSN